MRLVPAIVFAGLIVAIAPSQIQAQTQKKQRDLITLEELGAIGPDNLDLYEAIRRLRPQFLEKPKGLRTLGGGMMNPIMVVVDGRRGDMQLLTQTRAFEVQEVRYVEPSRAQNDYGINANGGAIVVKMIKAKAKPKPPAE